MEELARIKTATDPGDILLVADAMTGQDAVNVAKAFHEKLHLTGVVLTKMDGDARGGAALSIRAVTGAPVKFVGTGEKAEALEPFHPTDGVPHPRDGDILTFVEKAQEQVDEKQAKELERKLRKAEFTLEDFRTSSCGCGRWVDGGDPRDDPGARRKMKELKGAAPDEAELKKVVAIIDSMTAQERRNAKVLNGSRRSGSPRERHHGAGRQPPDEELPAGGGDDQTDGEGGKRGMGETSPSCGSVLGDILRSCFAGRRGRVSPPAGKGLWYCSEIHSTGRRNGSWR